MNALPTLLAAPFLAVVPLLDPVPAPGDVKPGWWATLLVVGLIIATILLWFSLRKQLGRIRFPEDQEGREADASPSEGSAPDVRRDNGAGSA